MEFLSSISGIYLHDFADPAFWMAVGSIILVDLVLSGDNAIIIAMACRNLPKCQQKKGIILGTFGAIGLRMVLGGVIIYLLKVPLLQAFGALLLAWIAIKLLQQQKEHEVMNAPDCLWKAVKTIIAADAVMSLDNVVAVAGVADGKPGLLWFGLIVSIPLVIYGSRLFLSLIDRFNWILYVGAAILGWTAGEMLIHDPIIAGFLNYTPFDKFLANGKLSGFLFAVLVTVIGWHLNSLQKKKESDNLSKQACNNSL